jgi:hypothetical protein
MCVSFAECGRTLQDSQGTFGSPEALPVAERSQSSDPTLASSHQPPVQLCQWRISATHGEKIVLNLTMIDLPESPDCLINYVEVRDGPAVTAPLLGL